MNIPNTRQLTATFGGYLASPNQYYPLSQLIKTFGADFENDPGKILLWGNIEYFFIIVIE